MAATCPICKKHKMNLGGMAALDGGFCSKCYDRAVKKGIKGDLLKTLTIREITEYLEQVPNGETEQWLKEIKERRTNSNR